MDHYGTVCHCLTMPHNHSQSAWELALGCPVTVWMPLISDIRWLYVYMSYITCHMSHVILCNMIKNIYIYTMNLVIPNYIMFAFALSQAWTETRFPTLVGLSVPCALTILRRHFPTCRFPSASSYSFASGKTLKMLQLWISMISSGAEVLSAFLFWSCVPFSFLLCFFVLFVYRCLL